MAVVISYRLTPPSECYPIENIDTFKELLKRYKYWSVNFPKRETIIERVATITTKIETP
jgi:hypothetical protein